MYDVFIVYFEDDVLLEIYDMFRNVDKENSDVELFFYEIIDLYF